MKNGGYKIIDLKDTNLTTSASATLSGIYEAIESNYRKPILLSGIVIDSVEKADAFVTVSVSDSNFVISNLYGMNLTITDEDAITTEEVPAALHSYNIRLGASQASTAVTTDNISLTVFTLYINLVTANTISTVQDVYDYFSNMAYTTQIPCFGSFNYESDDTSFYGHIKYVSSAKNYPSDTSIGFKISSMTYNSSEKTINTFRTDKTITEASFLALACTITEL